MKSARPKQATHLLITHEHRTWARTTTACETRIGVTGYTAPFMALTVNPELVTCARCRMAEPVGVAR